MAPDVATESSNRWVVVPISRDPRLADVPLAVPMPASPGTGLHEPSFAMAWLPTTVRRQQLSGPFGRISRDELKAVLEALCSALDLDMLEPWRDATP